MTRYLRADFRAQDRRARERNRDVETQELLKITENAGQAFGAFDWSAHAGKGVRLFVQGFG